ncbi:PREDICTED: titin-like [Cyprinodon variegatus]|uniref:titin-like n=1 Tax=Cyprinodon variegatus TaxID=28743 RepID=UPI0007429E74|nr:PREDICTED: titin-like [Cyprinodon variegatus]
MASMKTRQGMVILKEGATAPAAAPAADHSPAGLVTLRTGKFQNVTAVQGISVSIGEKKITKKVKMLPAKEAAVKMGELKHPSSLNVPSGFIPPDCICKGVKVTLDNNSMWNEFFKCRTEMILTKQGSRMFPYLRFHISGLQPSRKYSLMMDIEPLENSQYKWTGESWQVCKKAECYVKSKPFVHPDSPATGQHWMQSPVSFYKLKLTNDISEQEGNIFLRPMQRYLPQLHLVPADRAGEDLRLNAPNVLTFTFPQTEFMTVTSYQNPQFTQLKVNYNPFVKKLKEDKVNSCGLKPTGTSSKDLNGNEGKANSELHPMKKNLKVLLANHKLRQKASDSKVSAPKEPSEESRSSDAGVPEECPSSSRPAPKLISELICEAHVSLQRCRVEQSGGGSFSRGAAPGNTTSTTMTDRNRSVVHKNNGSVTTSGRKMAAAETAGKVKSDERLSSSSDRTVAAPPLEPLPSNKPDHQRDAGASSDAEKQQKRPTRLPLPALALFLKQHSAKSKKAKNKADTVPQTSQPESSATSQQKDIMEVSREDILPEERGLDGPGGTPPQPPSPDMLPGSDPLVSPSESLSLGPPDPNEGPMMSNPEKSCGPVQASAPAVSACSTSASSHLSLPLSTTLSLPDSPRAAGEPSTLPSSSRSVKLDSVLPDPQCSSFDFDPLSPASSAESLPPLPASLALELDSSSSAEEEPSSRNSSVFKWHTVLPLSEAYSRSPFPALEPPQQSTPLMSVSPPLFSCLPEPQSQTPSPSNPPKEPLPSFSEGEQSLPFPAELSPLALQLSLSPTFSSLDEDGLSPTTSLSDLVHFFSTDDDMGVEFSNPEAVATPVQAPPASELPQPSAPVQAASCSRSCKRKKSSRTTQLDRLEVGEDEDDYRSKQPKVEEVEEQLFISFTSKEALKLHTAESSEEQLPNPPPVPEPPPAEEPELRSTGSLEERIAVCEETILRDLKLMKHRQVIHPVLQEVGLKMTLLDPALSIDLQYLGVCLPIPPPGAMEPQTQTEPTPQGIFASFQSRTGKTTDVTQIKGWKEKFPPPEAESPAAPKLEAAGPSSDVQKKNLSAFCSDMLDEYLESEGKLIDERASTFSQLPVEAPPFQLPLSGASYVRTLDHVLKKATAGSPASDIISGFIPPSKRSRLKKIPNCRKTARKRRRPRWTRFRASPATPQRPAAGPVQDAVQTPGGPAQPTEPQNPPTPKKRRLKPRTSSRTLGAPGSTHVSEDMAPLESDSELRTDSGPNQLSDRTGEPGGKEKRASGTRALARLKELEDGVAWEGCFQTSITEERATIALMSLFTQTMSSSFTADRIRTILPLARKGKEQLGLEGTSWDQKGPPGTRRDQLGPEGTTWNREVTSWD